VDAKHPSIFQKHEEKSNIKMRYPYERQPTNKRTIVSSSAISIYFWGTGFFYEK
jgi:hypothetical protein